MKRLAFIGVFVLIAGGGFWATKAFFNSPYYSLYQIGKAIHERQPRLFLAYVDIGAIVAGQKDALVEEFVPKENQGFARQLVSGLMKALAPQINQIIKDRVVRALMDPKRDNLPNSWILVTAAQVSTNGDYALAEFNDSKANRRLRLGMRRDPAEGVWRVVEVNPQDLKVLIKDYLKDKYPPKKKEPSAKTG